jgi:hypothetical protein
MGDNQPLSPKQVDQFLRSGFLVLKGVLSRAEADNFRQKIIDMVPRDLNIPLPWAISAGRIKPYHEGYHEQETRYGHEDDGIFDTPELLPLLCNETVYRAASQLMGRSNIRVQDGTIGITLRSDDVIFRAGGRRESDIDSARAAMSQPLHVDPSIPDDADNFTFSESEVQIGAVYYLTDVESKGGGLFAVPGSHVLVREECEASDHGRRLHNGWIGIEGFPPPVEVIGDAGDVILTHYLLAHGASHNRRVRTRIAYFTRYSCLDHPFFPPPTPTADRFNTRQLSAMGAIGRKLMGVDPWE